MPHDAASEARFHSMMSTHLSDQLLAQVQTIGGQYHRLILLVSGAGDGKTSVFRELAETQGWPRINLNLQLAERLLELTRKQRVVRLPALLSQILSEQAGDVVLVDNLEMLFYPELSHDPLKLLQGLSRNRTIVAAWPGGYDGETVSYAQPGHPEFRKYPAAAVVVVGAPDSVGARQREEIS
jgi:hypothetical protein